jgi:hypothetical protein
LAFSFHLPKIFECPAHGVGKFYHATVAAIAATSADIAGFCSLNFKTKRPTIERHKTPLNHGYPKYLHWLAHGVGKFYPTPVVAIAALSADIAGFSSSIPRQQARD